MEVNNSLEKLHFMTWGFIRRLWPNCPPPLQTGRQEGEVTKAQTSRGFQGQRPGGGILSKWKRNVYYQWKWTSPLKLHVMTRGLIWRLWTNCSPLPPAPPPPHPQPGDRRGGHKCANVQQFLNPEGSEPTVAPFPHPPPPIHNRETGEEVTNVQMPSSSQGRAPRRPLGKAKLPYKTAKAKLP